MAYSRKARRARRPGAQVVPLPVPPGASYFVATLEEMQEQLREQLIRNLSIPADVLNMMGDAQYASLYTMERSRGQ